MKLIKKLSPFFVVGCTPMICLPLTVSCNKVNFDFEPERLEYMEDLFAGQFVRQSQVVPVEPQEKIHESEATTRYLKNVRANHMILVDDVLWALSHMQAQTKYPATGKIGLAITDVNPNNQTVSFNVNADKILLQEFYPAMGAIEFSYFNGKIITKNIPFNIYWMNKSFEPFMEPEWWLCIDQDRLFVKKDINWSVDLAFTFSIGYVEYQIDIDLSGHYDKNSDFSAMADLFFDISFFLSDAEIPLNFMHNVINLSQNI